MQGGRPVGEADGYTWVVGAKASFLDVDSSHREGTRLLVLALPHAVKCKMLVVQRNCEAVFHKHLPEHLDDYVRCFEGYLLAQLKLVKRRACEYVHLRYVVHGRPKISQGS